jgi:hypothetical protein
MDSTGQNFKDEPKGNCARVLPLPQTVNFFPTLTFWQSGKNGEVEPSAETDIDKRRHFL